MKLRMLNLLTILPILLSVAITQLGAQTPKRDNRPRTASIGGRVTIGDAPAANALVMVMEVDPKSLDDWFVGEYPQRAYFRVRTGGDGRYQVTGLTEGAYKIRSLSKAYVWSKNSSKFETFKSVTLDEGEAREGVDIALVRGGVITGRVIDVEGRPLIASALSLQSVDENGKPIEGIDDDHWMAMDTDDRGIYRIYGLAAGRYIISAGGEFVSNRAKGIYPQTFYPDAANQGQAKVIEVKEGTETTGIDIRLGAEKRTYEATGRVFDAETGQPLKHVSLMCQDAPEGENGERRFSLSTKTDDEGRFRFFGLSSGRYEALMMMNWEDYYRSTANNEHYSEKTRFEISDSDVSGLEIKAIRGSTISGVVVIEGVDDQVAKAMLKQLVVSVQIIGKRGPDGGQIGYEGRGMSSAKVSSDGGIRLTGLAPGLARFDLRGPQENKFLIKRIERNSAEIRSAFEIGRSEQITGVRIVAAYGNGTIRGQVEITGGKLPEGRRLSVWAIPIRTVTADDGIPAFQSRAVDVVVDNKGRFVIERLASGEYELTLTVIERTGQNEWSGSRAVSEFKQRITVNSGAESPAKFLLDLSHRQNENRQ